MGDLPDCFLCEPHWDASAARWETSVCPVLTALTTILFLIVPLSGWKHLFTILNLESFILFDMCKRALPAFGSVHHIVPGALRGQKGSSVP